MHKTAGVIAEFNPFHNGHAALLAFARQQGATHVVAVMSGNFVQRGCCAIADKRLRTRAALKNGADLVLELPLPFATSAAPRFARGAVELLAATGCIDFLCFGSECGNAPLLQELSLAVDHPATTGALPAFLSQGLTFARARQLAVEKGFGPETAAVLATPNNALGVEYLRQARKIGWQIPCATLPRLGAAHDAPAAVGSYASASFLRQLTGIGDLAAYVPPSAQTLYRQAAQANAYPANQERLETAILSCLRKLSPGDLARLPDLSEGLEHRLYKAIRSARSLAELEAAAKSKRYTLARVRRLILHAFLGVTEEDCLTPPPYLRILGFGPEGAALLARMKSSAILPAHTSLAKLETLGHAAGRFALLEASATDQFALALPRPLPCGYEYSASAVYL